MKRILGMIALTCVLALPALAGEIPTCNCWAATGGGRPTAGSINPVKKELPDAESLIESGDTTSSLLTTVLLTLVSFAVR